MIKVPGILLMFSYLSASTLTNNETGWSFEVTPSITNYYFHNIMVTEDQTVEGDGLFWNTDGYCNDNSYNCHVIGAFVMRDGIEVCVGGTYGGNDGTMIPVMGYWDTHPNYTEIGEIPYFKIYDPFEDTISLLITEEIEGFNNDINVYDTAQAFNIVGDVNQDNSVNVMDITILVNIILED